MMMEPMITKRRAYNDALSYLAADQQARAAAWFRDPAYRAQVKHGQEVNQLSRWRVPMRGARPALPGETAQGRTMHGQFFYSRIVAPGRRGGPGTARTGTRRVARSAGAPRFPHPAVGVPADRGRDPPYRRRAGLRPRGRGADRSGAPAARPGAAARPHEPAPAGPGIGRRPGHEPDPADADDSDRREARPRGPGGARGHRGRSGARGGHRGNSGPAAQWRFTSCTRRNSRAVSRETQRLLRDLEDDEQMYAVGEGRQPDVLRAQVESRG